MTFNRGFIFSVFGRIFELFCVLLCLAIGCGMGAGCDTDDAGGSDSVVFIDSQNDTDSEDTETIDSHVDGDITRNRDTADPDTTPRQGRCTKAIESKYCQRCAASKRLEHPPFMCEETGGKPIDYSSINWCFQVPTSGRPPKTASDLREDFPNGAPGSIISTPAAPDHSAACDMPYNLYAKDGDSVTYNYGVWIPDKHYNFQNKDEVRVVVSGFLNYRSVETEVTLRSPERTQVVEQQLGNGVAFETGQRIIQLDITFPSSAFDEARTYEGGSVVTVINKDSIVHTDQRRFAIHYGSTKIKKRPCFEQPKLNEWGPAFKEMMSQSALSHGALGVKAEDGSPAAPSQRITVKPGETLEYTYYFFNVNNSKRRHLMMVPTLQGANVASPKAFVDPAGGSSFAVLGKKPFSFKAPSEPGVYHLKVAEFRDPYLLSSDPHACNFDNIDENTTSSGSQTIQITVASD